MAQNSRDESSSGMEKGGITQDDKSVALLMHQPRDSHSSRSSTKLVEKCITVYFAQCSWLMKSKLFSHIDTRIFARERGLIKWQANNLTSNNICCLVKVLFAVALPLAPNQCSLISFFPLFVEHFSYYYIVTSWSCNPIRCIPGKVSDYA